jgi:hypothetical protein
LLSPETGTVRTPGVGDLFARPPFGTEARRVCVGDTKADEFIPVNASKKAMNINLLTMN